MTGRYLGDASSFFFRRCAIANTTFFSLSLLGPDAPGSSPPCPASMATTTGRRVSTCSTVMAGTAGGAVLSDAEISYKSSTKRWPVRSLGFNSKLAGLMLEARSKTTRRSSPPLMPERTRVIGVPSSGRSVSTPCRDALFTSRTSLSGPLSSITLWLVGPVRSRTIRV